MKAAIREAGAPIQNVLDEHKVQSIDSCGVAKARHSITQTALLILAALLPLAALISVIVLCCLHSSGNFYMTYLHPLMTSGLAFPNESGNSIRKLSL